MRAKLLGQFFLRRSMEDSLGAAAWTLSRTNRLKLKRATGPSSFYNNVTQVIMGPRMQIKTLKAFKQFREDPKTSKLTNPVVFKHRLLSCVSKHAILLIRYSFYTLKRSDTETKINTKKPIRIVFDCSDCFPKFPMWFPFIGHVLGSKAFDNWSSISCKKPGTKIPRLLWWTGSLAIVNALWQASE